MGVPAIFWPQMDEKTEKAGLLDIYSGKMKPIPGKRGVFCGSCSDCDGCGNFTADAGSRGAGRIAVKRGDAWAGPRENHLESLKRWGYNGRGDHIDLEVKNMGIMDLFKRRKPVEPFTETVFESDYCG